MLVNCLKPGTVHSFADIAAAMNCDISESVAANMELHPLLWFINSAQAGFFKDWPGMEALGNTAFIPPSEGMDDIIGLNSTAPS
eukprot:1890813-Prorocentrum_lima.AAC.1